ncbi:hypothetical protein [Micromonospora inyonensis]|uniref:Orn/Lys/Arg family decarboxylase n=1 Tax=Micromonospora inyonensis TaxID=47866 RepID=UPI001C40787C
MVSPYPPGVPVLVPGERISQAALDYLTSGVRAGMLIPGLFFCEPSAKGSQKNNTSVPNLAATNVMCGSRHLLRSAHRLGCQADRNPGIAAGHWHLADGNPRGRKSARYSSASPN